MTEPLLSCSFCHKSQRDVLKLIAGQGVWICNECVDICVAMLEDGEGEIGTFAPPEAGYALSPAGHVAAICAICQESVLAEHSLLVRDRARVCGTCLDAIIAE